MTVKIWVVLHQKMLKHQINALFIIQTDWINLHHIICDSNYTQVQSIDIFVSILSEVINDWIDVMHLTTMQTDTLIYCWMLSYEIEIIQESLSTHKSYWCAEMIWSFLHKNNIFHSVLVVISMNITVDELILKIEKAVQKKTSTRNKIIVCLHIMSSKKDIIWSRVKEDCDSGSSVINKDELDIFADFDVVKTIYEIYKYTDWSKSDVINKRVQLIEHSLTTWMLWVTEMIPHLIFKPNQWKKFWKYYNHHNEENLNAEQIKKFHKLINVS